MLPLHQRVVFQVRYFRRADSEIRLKDDPTNMRPKKTSFGIVRIEVGIGVSVMRSVSACPPIT